MSDPGIGTYVRYWLHYGDLASSFFKQYNSARNIRGNYEKQIIGILQQNGMEKAKIQINNGELRVVDKREPTPLCLSKVEELLHGYFKHRGGKDETLDIMMFIRANRGYSITKNLKQSGPPKPSSDPPRL